MSQRQQLNGPMLTRAATATAEILDEEARLVRVSFSSEIPYTRSSWFDDPWIEVLGHKPSEVDMSRIKNGSAPVLWGHRRGQRADMVGIVETGKLADGRGFADLRLSKRADLADLWADIKDGIVRNVSVGYQILERVLTKKNEKGPSEYRVTRWAPYEISFVDVPADHTVGVGRSADADGQRFVITDLEDDVDSNTPNDEEQRAVTTAATAQAPSGTAAEQNTQNAAAVAAAEQRGAAAERTRVAEIQALVARSKADASIATRCVAEGLTIDQTRAAIIEYFATRDENQFNHNSPHVEAGAAGIDKVRAGMEDWLLARTGERRDGKVIDLHGNEFRGMALRDMARDCLERAGVKTRGMDVMTMVGRAITHTTSDFPVLLESVVNKTLLAAYAAVPDVWREIAGTGSVADFRPHYRYRMGSFADIDLVNEAGEFKDGTLPDGSRELIQAATKGKILNLSRQMIINDDLGVFTNVARMMGRGAARTIEKDVFALLALQSNTGPNMGDGSALFHANHNNIASAAAPSVASFETARLAMGNQLEPGGNDYISVRPAVWLGPLALEAQARLVNDAQYNPDVSNKTFLPNISRNLVRKVIGTPRLQGTRWYLFADPNEEPTLEVVFLNGQQTPFLDQQEGFRVDGMQWKVRLDYGVGAVGWRGAITNAGA